MLAMTRDEVVARLGDQRCEVKTLDSTHLYCEPPEEQPLSTDPESEFPSLQVSTMCAHARTHTDTHTLLATSETSWLLGTDNSDLHALPSHITQMHTIHPHLPNASTKLRGAHSQTMTFIYSHVCTSSGLWPGISPLWFSQW